MEVMGEAWGTWGTGGSSLASPSPVPCGKQQEGPAGSPVSAWVGVGGQLIT